MGFLEAVETGNTEQLQELIDAEGLPIDSKWTDYDLLNHALINGQKKSATMLIERGCRVNKISELHSESTPLHHAIKLGSIEIVELLLRKGALIETKNCEGETPLHLSAKLRNDIFTDVLLSSLNNSDDINCMDNSGLTYLHIACMRDNLGAIEHLLKSNSEINHPINLDSTHLPGYSALHCAIAFYSKNAVQLLLSHNASMNVKAKNGLTPIHLAVKYGQLKFVKMLLRNSTNLAQDVNAQVDADSQEHPGYSALHFSVEFYFPQILRLLLRCESNINATSKTGLTPLHIAVRKGHSDLVDALLEDRADVNCAELENSSTALHLATLDKYQDIIGMLLSKGSDVNAQQRDGMSPLHVAASWSHVEGGPKKKVAMNSFFDLLNCQLANGGQRVDAYPEVPSTEKNDEIVDLLLSADSILDGNPVDHRGLTHFHIACTREKGDLVRKFLEKGVKVNDRVKGTSLIWPGYTALHFAVEFDRKYIVDLLLKRNANVLAVNAKGMTPIHLAHLLELTHSQSMIDAMLDHLHEEVSTSPDPAAHYGLSSFHVACMRSHSSLYRECLDDDDLDIDAALRVESPVWPGCTALHLAVLFQRRYAVEHLVSYGADTNAREARGLTPLHVACMYKDGEIVKLLLEQDAGVHLTANADSVYVGGTALHVAFSQRNPIWSIIEQLLDEGADINAEDAQGDTPLSCFNKIACKNLDVMNLLTVINISGNVRAHVLSLRTVNLPISGKTEKELIEINKRSGNNEVRQEDVRFSKKCVAEVKKLKRVKIDKYTTLYDILHRDCNEMSKHVKNEAFEKILESANFDKTYPVYGCLLKAQAKRGRARAFFYECAKEALDFVVGRSLPDSCAERVFKYLKNQDLLSLTRAEHSNFLTHGKLPYC